MREGLNAKAGSDSVSRDREGHSIDRQSDAAMQIGRRSRQLARRIIIPTFNLSETVNCRSCHVVAGRDKVRQSLNGHHLILVMN